MLQSYARNGVCPTSQNGNTSRFQHISLIFPHAWNNQRNYQSLKKKFMKKNGLFNLQEQKAYPIFANAAETQTPFCRPDDTRRLLQKSFSTYPPTTQTYSINTNFSKLWELSNKESWEASQAE